MSQQFILDIANRVAQAMATTRPDYQVMTAGDVGEGDGVRLVPAPGNPVAGELCQPLVVTHAAQGFGLCAISCRPRAAAVCDHLTGWPSGDEPGVEDFEWTVVLDAEYPILVR